MRRLPIPIGVLIAAGVVFWLMPPFRIVRLDQARQQQDQGVFDAAAFAGKFWTNQLMTSPDGAHDASTLLHALEQDPAAARERYGHTVGLSSAAYYFLKGTGTVVSVERSHVGVSLETGKATPDILLQTGLVFGNSVRDATGLLDVSQFANSQQFNAIAAELNALVESQVIPGIRSNAAPGRVVRFVGCAEVVEDAAQVRPLKVVPVQVVFPSPEAAGTNAASGPNKEAGR